MVVEKSPLFQFEAAPLLKVLNQTPICKDGIHEGGQRMYLDLSALRKVLGHKVCHIQSYFIPSLSSLSIAFQKAQSDIDAVPVKNPRVRLGNHCLYSGCFDNYRCEFS